MRALALHSDVLLVTSAVLQSNCVVVRGGAEQDAASEASGAAETFVIDSPVLPDELDALPTLLEQARFPSPSGLLATHADWDHLLGRLAFPGLALGCAESSAERLAATPGVAQRELRAFDEALLVERTRPLALGSLQALPVPGRCAIGEQELELHRADGHTVDGMAIYVPWASVLVVGDYLSPIEIPTTVGCDGINAYLQTLERLQELIGQSEHVVPGHGQILDRDRARILIDEDADYLSALRARGKLAELPPERRSAANRRKHVENVTSLGA